MNVTGHLPDLRFALVDDEGEAVTAGNYQGDVVLLYFGFTGCAAQCPVTLARLNHVLRLLHSGHARALFVTVNPANDTPARLHQYLNAFDPQHMTGLTGSENEIAALAKRMRAAYRPRISTGDAPHSNAVYIFDASGAARLLATPEDADEKIIHDVRQLMHVAG